MIRIPRLAFLGVFILFMCVFFMFVGWPIGLWWLLLIPVAVIVWILRTQTTVSEAGLDLRTVFKSRHLDWSQLKGVRIPKRGYVRADLIDGTEVKLPAVSYDRVRDLAVASQGRIPNPYAVPPAEAGSTSADAGSTRTDPSSTSADAGSSGETGSTSADAGAVSADTVAASDDATAAAVETDGGADTSDSGKDADKRESDARKNGAE